MTVSAYLASSVASCVSSYLPNVSWPELHWTGQDEVEGGAGGSWTLLWYGSYIAITALVYYVGFVPLERVKRVSDVGWGFLSEDDKRPIGDRIREVQRLRKLGQLPPVYPNGWFSVIESRRLKRGQVVQVQAFGETMAVFRGENGTVHVTEAYCPHMGASLAAGGVVKGDCLECPFHGWVFRGTDGACIHIPYTTRSIPSNAKVKVWLSREVNGRVFVWHDAEGRPPFWELPDIDAITKGEWSYRGRTYHEVLAHIQEIPENGADIAHLHHLHLPSIFKGSDLRFSFADSPVLDLAQHHWDGKWQARDAPEAHRADLVMTHALALFGGKYKLFEMKVRAEQIGPGIVHLNLDTPLGSGVMVQTITPIEPMRQMIVHEFHASNWVLAPYAKFVLRAEAIHVERDIMIWNNKLFQAQPLLVSEDHQIGKFRRWYSQFYSENSPKFSFKKDTLDW